MRQGRKRGLSASVPNTRKLAAWLGRGLVRGLNRQVNDRRSGPAKSRDGFRRRRTSFGVMAFVDAVILQNQLESAIAQLHNKLLFRWRRDLRPKSRRLFEFV